MLARRNFDHRAGLGVEQLLLQFLLESDGVRGQRLRRRIAARGDGRAENCDGEKTQDMTPRVAARSAARH